MAKRKISYSYFVVMEDHGKRGLEGIVHPEDTRRNIIDRLKSGDYAPIIAFIDHVVDGLAEDVTAELFDEAEIELRAEHVVSRADRIANTQDHNRKLAAEAV